MSRKSKLIKYQAMKYSVWILVFLAGMFTVRAVWELTFWQYIFAFATVIVLLIVSIVFDIISVKDAFGYFKN